MTEPEQGPADRAPSPDRRENAAAAASLAQVKPEILELVAKLSASTYRGPLPPPAVLEGYEKVVPGSAKRVFDIFEKQADHRMSIEKSVIGSDIQRSWAGLAVAGALSIGVIWLGYQLVISGNPLAGTFITALNITGLAGTFLWNTRERRLEREHKATIMASAGQPPQEEAVGLDVTEAQLEARRRNGRRDKGTAQG